MTQDDRLSALGALVRRHDPDRFFTAVFAPAARREALFALYAFNHEIARAREAVREPMAALIRLHWWREVVEGARRRHEVAGPVGEALDAGLLLPADLLGMIEAREAEAEPMDSMADFEAYALGSAGGVMVAAARALGMAAPEALRPWGAAYGVTGVLRSVPALARQGRCILPRDLLADAGLSEGAVVAAPDAPGLKQVRASLLSAACAWLDMGVAVPRAAMAAVLPVAYARRDVRRGSIAGERPVWDRLAIVKASLLGRV
jgi:phytoene synthase